MTKKYSYKTKIQLEKEAFKKRFPNYNGEDLERYRDNPYGRLKMAYDIYSKVDFDSLTASESDFIYFEIESLKNDIIDYIAHHRIKHERQENILYYVSELHKMKMSLNTTSALESKNNEIKNSFDFDFDLNTAIDGNQNEINTYLKDAILKVINSNKSEHEITPKKGNKNAGRPKSKIKDIIEIIDKSWNIQGKKYFVEKLEKDFKDIQVKYNDGQKKNLNYLILALMNLNILKSGLRNKQYFESVGKRIIGVIPKGQSGFNAQLKNGENYVKNQAEYIDIENKLNKIVEHINNTYPDFELK